MEGQLEWCMTAIFIVAILDLPVTSGSRMKRETAVQKGPVVACYPETDSRETCEAAGCIWEGYRRHIELPNYPHCYYPEGVGYQLLHKSKKASGEYSVLLKRPDSDSHAKSAARLQMDIESNSDTVHVKIVDPDSTRFEVPAEALDTPLQGDTQEATDGSRQYVIEFQDKPQFGVRVRRYDTDTIVFDTSLPGLKMDPQYVQLTLPLVSPNVYGFGEHNHQRYRHDLNWKRWAIFAADIPATDRWNLYGVQTFFMNIDSSGRAHGVFLKNSNAMDVVLQPEPHPAVSYHVIGGILDFYIFLGPSPEQVVQQYTRLVGRPMMPPYWSLGFHLSRYGYSNSTHAREVVERNRRAKIPLDVFYGDIDYMHKYMDFTYDRAAYYNLPEFVKEVNSNGMRYVIILDPAIADNPEMHQSTHSETYGPFTDGVEMDVFIKEPNPIFRRGRQHLQGKVWPGTTAFPDFLHPNATRYWGKWCKHTYDKLGLDFSGLWIDMNEPANFVHGSTDGCRGNSWHRPPYMPDIQKGDEFGLQYKTICMDAEQTHGKHYYLHNLYGHSQAMVSYKVLREMFPKKRPFVLTRSNFAGTGHWAAHWTGDNHSGWVAMHWSIVTMLEYGLFGVPMVGADICGYFDDVTDELCLRWSQLGAFYPYARNHNSLGSRSQDPAAFPSKVRSAIRDALRIRYRLLPYLYTLMHLARTGGNTVARPLVHEFPKYTEALGIDKQFLWGPALLIVPVLTEGETTVRCYLPSSEHWYNYHTKQLEKATGWVTVKAPLTRIPLFLRGGHIIPWQEPAETTVQSRLKPFGLMVVLDRHGEAFGRLFWDDGESFATLEKGTYLLANFTAAAGTLSINIEHNGFKAQLAYDTLQICCLSGSTITTSRVRVNDSPLSGRQALDFDSNKGLLTLSNMNLTMNSAHNVQWSHNAKSGAGTLSPGVFFTTINVICGHNVNVINIVALLYLLIWFLEAIVH